MWLQKLRTLPWGVAMLYRLWIAGKLENIIFAHRVGFPCVLRSGAAYDFLRRAHELHSVLPEINSNAAPTCQEIPGRLSIESMLS